jgi:hypothetical protein
MYQSYYNSTLNDVIPTDSNFDIDHKNPANAFVNAIKLNVLKPLNFQDRSFMNSTEVTEGNALHIGYNGSINIPNRYILNSVIPICVF